MDWKFITNKLLENMTQQELAAKADCSQPFISLLSSGKRKNVDFDTGQKLISLCVLNGVEARSNNKAPATANS